VSGVRGWLFDARPNRWRRAQIWEFDQGEVKQVRLEGPREKWIFDRTPAGWSGTANGRPIPNLSTGRVMDLLRAFRSLRADDFAEEGADTGLDASSTVSTVSFVLAGGRRQTIAIAKTRKGGGRYARAAGDSTVYVIPEYVAGWSEPTLRRFIDPGAEVPGLRR
jgi:hypothetical protein